MANRTRAQLRTGAKRRADMENASFVSDAEWNDYINSGIAKLHMLLVGEDGGSLFAKVAPQLPIIGPPASENKDAILSVHQLPADFYRLIDVAINTGSIYLRATRADEQEYAQLLTQTYNGIAFTRYYLQWNHEQGRYELFVFPAVKDRLPENLFVRYIPGPPVLSLDSDELKYPANWYEWVEMDAAIQALDKEESDPSPIYAAQEKLEKLIRDAINDVNKTSIKKIRDVSYWEDRPRGPWSRFPILNYN